MKENNFQRIVIKARDQLLRVEAEASLRAAMEERELPCCVRGYHVYQAIWAAVIGEVLPCTREPTNPTDRYAVAVVKSGTIIGHLPRKISKLCSLFLSRGGSISCTVTGGRQYSADLPQGGLEIPCSLLFKAKAKEMLKFKKCLKICFKNSGSAS